MGDEECEDGNVPKHFEFALQVVADDDDAEDGDDPRLMIALEVDDIFGGRQQRCRPRRRPHHLVGSSRHCQQGYIFSSSCGNFVVAAVPYRQCRLANTRLVVVVVVVEHHHSSQPKPQQKNRGVAKNGARTSVDKKSSYTNVVGSNNAS